MTLPNLTSPTAELIAYRDTLKAEIDRSERERRRLVIIEWNNTELLFEVLDELNRRESCQHPGLTDGTCSGCGLPADQIPSMTTTNYILVCKNCGIEFELTDAQYNLHYTDYCRSCFENLSVNEDDSPWEDASETETK